MQGSHQRCCSGPGHSATLLPHGPPPLYQISVLQHLSAPSCHEAPGQDAGPPGHRRGPGEGRLVAFHFTAADPGPPCGPFRLGLGSAGYRRQPVPAAVIPAAERRQLGEYYTPSWLRRCPPTAAPAGPASKDPITVPTAGTAAPPAISAPLLISRRRLSSRSGRLSETLLTDPRYMSPCSKRQSKPYTEKGRFAPAIR